MARLRDYFTVFVIIFMTGINLLPDPTRSFNSSDVAVGNITTQIIKSAFYVIAFCLLISKWKFAVRLGTKNILIWLALVWVFASTTWSEDPSVTLRTSVGLLGTTIIALYLASFYDYARLAFLAAWAFLIIDILSFLVIVFFPAQGISLDPYGWQGIYFTKNGLGVNSLFGIILFVSLLTNNKTIILGIVGFTLSIILLIGSKSTTSLLSAIFAMSIWCVLQAYLNRNRLVLISLMVFLLVLFLSGMWLYFTNNIATVIGFLGKDLTLTGRTSIWDASIWYIKQSPWLGYGYGAVWLGRDYGIGSLISGAVNYYTVNSHDGYLDMLLEIGIIGVILVIVVIITTLYKLLSNLGNTAGVKSYEIWPIVFLIVLLVYNSTEAALLVQNSIDWILIAFLGFNIPSYSKTYLD